MFRYTELAVIYYTLLVSLIYNRGMTEHSGIKKPIENKIYDRQLIPSQLVAENDI